MSARESFASLGLHAGSDARVRCSTYPAQNPILALDLGPVTFNLSVAGRAEMPGWGVEFARDLARQVQRFAAECERRHVIQHDQGTASAQAKGTAA